MYEPITLTPDQPDAYTTTPYTAEAVSIDNYTPFPVYVRLGDHRTPNSSNYHIVVPPSTGRIIAVRYVSKFSFALGVSIFSAQALTTLSPYRAEIAILAGEDIPRSTQYQLPLTPIQFNFTVPLAGTVQTVVVDCGGSLALLIQTNVFVAANPNALFMRVSFGPAATGPWAPFYTWALPSGIVAVNLVRSLPIANRYVRIEFWAIAPTNVIAGICYVSTSQRLETVTPRYFNFQPHVAGGAVVVGNTVTLCDIAAGSGRIAQLTVTLDRAAGNRTEVKIDLHDISNPIIIALQDTPDYTAGDNDLDYGNQGPPLVFSSGQQRGYLILPDIPFYFGLTITAAPKVQNWANYALAASVLLEI